MIFAAFFIATAIVLVMSAYCAWRDFTRFGDVLGAAQLLMVILGLSFICRIAVPPHGMGNMIWLSVIDLGGLMMTAYWYVTRKSVWSFALCFTYIAQLVAHYGYWRSQSLGVDTRYAYILTLNALAVLQLLTVGWPGASYVARDVRALLHDRRGWRVPLGHGAPQ